MLVIQGGEFNKEKLRYNYLGTFCIIFQLELEYW